MSDELVEKLDPVRPHGLSMVAAYRAQRTAQRGNLKQVLQQSRAALRAERQQRIAGSDAPGPATRLPTVPTRKSAAPDWKSPAAVDAIPTAAGGVAEIGVDGPAGIGPVGVTQASPGGAAGHTADDAVCIKPGGIAPDAGVAAATLVAPHGAAKAAETVGATNSNRPASAAPPDLSVFAHLVDIRSPTPPPAPVVSAPADAIPDTAAEEPVSQPVAEPCPDGDMAGALTTIVGFGPGMVMRLRQLGYHTAGDLADADPERLRQALGNISRLLDVDAWIAHAKRQRDGR